MKPYVKQNPVVQSLKVIGAATGVILLLFWATSHIKSPIIEVKPPKPLPPPIETRPPVDGPKTVVYQLQSFPDGAHYVAVTNDARDGSTLPYHQAGTDAVLQ